MAANFFKTVKGMPKIDKILIKIAARPENLLESFKKLVYGSRA
jgi:hypothetical protein